MLTLMTIFWQLKLPWLSTLLAVAGKRGALSSGTIVLTLAIGLAIGVAVAAYYLIRNQKPSTESLARGLFRELCRAHQLSGTQSKLVWQLATLLKLPCPATLFVDSSAWRIPEGDLDKKDWDKLQKIHKTLFQPPNV